MLSAQAVQKWASRDPDVAHIVEWKSSHGDQYWSEFVQALFRFSKKTPNQHEACDAHADVTKIARSYAEQCPSDHNDQYLAWVLLSSKYNGKTLKQRQQDAEESYNIFTRLHKKSGSTRTLKDVESALENLISSNEQVLSDLPAEQTRIKTFNKKELQEQHFTILRNLHRRNEYYYGFKLGSNLSSLATGSGTPLTTKKQIKYLTEARKLHMDYARINPGIIDYLMCTLIGLSERLRSQKKYKEALKYAKEALFFANIRSTVSSLSHNTVIHRVEGLVEVGLAKAGLRTWDHSVWLDAVSTALWEHNHIDPIAGRIDEIRARYAEGQRLRGKKPKRTFDQVLQQAQSKDKIQYASIKVTVTDFMAWYKGTIDRDGHKITFTNLY